ncbi:MAG: hypothetical protein K8H88_09905 [Sandaracinaceae bacterium]|nr:hypothetical protein [Sandaracinaceae bacterium]
MARMTLGQKAQRVLTLLLGLRSPRVAMVLRAFGFDEAELDRGWALLSRLTANRLSALPQMTDPRLVRELDAWENKWFPIAEVVLRTNHPSIAEEVFRNLSQTSGPEVVVGVATFVQRVSALEERGGEAARARELLERRGLTEEILGEARGLLQQINDLAPADEEQVAPEEGEADEAETAMWNWYLEWSGIARVAIQDRRLLRSLGFLRSTRSGNDTEDPDEPGPEPEPAPS